MKSVDTERIADLISDEFIRLGVSVNDDPCSGLMARVSDVDSDLVAIYNDYDEADYDGERVLTLLLTLSPEDVSIGGNDPNNVWGLIDQFKV